MESNAFSMGNYGNVGNLDNAVKKKKRVWIIDFIKWFRVRTTPYIKYLIGKSIRFLKKKRYYGIINGCYGMHAIKSDSKNVL